MRVRVLVSLAPVLHPCAPLWLQWGGEQCNLLQFQPVAFPQGYGMTPNLTSWGGNIVPDPSGTSYHLFAAEMVNGCGLNVRRGCVFVFVLPPGPLVFLLWVAAFTAPCRCLTPCQCGLLLQRRVVTCIQLLYWDTCWFVCV